MITIIDYGVGNLTSIQNMFKKAGFGAIISTDINEIDNAEKILLPGMGAFDNCMKRFNESGLREVVEKKVLIDLVPVLGICVGLQMMMEGSEEGNLRGLGWVKGNTIRFKKELMAETQKIPNMGWLDIEIKKESKLMTNLENARFYFAHSHHVKPEERQNELVGAHYGYDFTAGIEWGNILGVQFHPEKSHRFGLQLLKNFVEYF